MRGNHTSQNGYVVNAPGGTLFGYPKGIYLVGGTEFWDRFSYYGMMGLMVLFLTDATASGGFAWSETSALRLYGIYTALIYITPVFGGWIASSWLGERRAVGLGATLIVLGHFLLGGPAYFPAIIDSLSGSPAHDALKAAHIPLGTLIPSKDMWDALAQAAIAAGVEVHWANAAYLSVSLSFYTGLGFIMVGTGLLKPAISTIIGGFYQPKDPRKDHAYTIFLVCIFLGGFMANFIAGTLGEKYGWHYGLGAAGVGMFIGLIIYFAKQGAWLGDIGDKPKNKVKSKTTTAQRLTAEEKNRLAVIAVTGIAAVVYAAIFYQKGGVLHLIARESTDRFVLGFEVPATWLLSISTGVFILLAPFSNGFWTWAEKKGVNLDLPTKLAIGLSLLTIGYAFQIFSAIDRDLSSDGVSSIWWFIPTYLCFGLGDVFFWPASYAAVSRLSPERMTSISFGVYYTVFGIGTWLSAEIGALSYAYEQKLVFIGLAALGFVTAVCLFSIRNILNRASQGEPIFFRRATVAP